MRESLQSKGKPLISVIVPVYNGEKYLKECIHSILNQTYENIELLIVDDGSTDESWKIILKESSNDDRICIYSQENGGVSRARNCALEHAVGEYVFFVDQDDVLSKFCIDYFVTLILKTESDISLTLCANRFENENYQLQDQSINEKVDIWSGEQAAEAMLYYRLVVAPWNKLIKRELIERNNIRFDERFFGGEGFLFSIQCFLCAKKVVVGNCRYYNYRIDNVTSGMTKFSLKVINSCIDAQKVMKELLSKQNEKLVVAGRYANWHTYCDCLNTLVGCQVVKRHKELYKNIRTVCKKEAVVVLHAPITLKEKMKGIVYMISPWWAAKVVNIFRKRRFTVNE